MKPVLDPTLLDLGRNRPSVDPFSVQPGIILFDRFCVVGRVRHSADFWRVQATDLERMLGLEPYHRVDLHFLPHASVDEAAIRAALAAHQRGSRRIEAVLGTEEALVVVSVPTEETPIRLPVAPEDAAAIARTLVGIVLAGSRAGVVGFHFDLRDLRFDSFGEVQFATWRHLTRLRLAEPHEDPDKTDAPAVVELLESLGDGSLAQSISSRTSIAALAQGLEGRCIPRAPSVAEIVPGIAPFVGREHILQRLYGAMASARAKGPELFVVTGSPGIGRSRLLEQVALELKRWNTVQIVRIGCSQAAPDHGLAVLLDAVADTIQSRPPQEQSDTITRLRQAIGPMVGVLSASYKLLTLIGEAETLHPLQIEEAFIRRSSCIADGIAALGTPERPLAILIDDFDQADISVRSVIHHLLVPTREHHTLVLLSMPEGTSPMLPREGTSLPLKPLPTQSIREMVAATVPGPLRNLERVVARLYAEARGIPHDTWNLLLHWLRVGLLAPSDQGSWVLQDELPVAIAEVRGLGGLPSTDRAIAALVAIRREPVEPGWLAELIGHGQISEVKAASAALIEAGVLIQDSGGRLGFPTDLVRNQVLAELEVSELRAAHGAIWRWLRDRGSPVLGQLAWHAEHATPPGREAELGALHLQAGQHHLSLGDAARGLWHFERALERTEDEAVVRACRRGMADALVLLERPAEALDTYLSVLDESEPPEALAIANDAIHSFYLRGATHEMLVLAERALGKVGERLARNSTDAAFIALRSLLGILFRTGPTDPAIADGLASIHVTIVAGVITILPHVGLGSLFRGLHAASRRRSGPAARVRAFFSVTLASVGLTGWMKRLLDQAEQEAIQSKDGMALGAVLHLRGQNEMSLGQYEAGAISMERALQEFRRIGDLSVGVISMALAAFYSLDREPTDALLQRLKLAETSAWRQRNSSILPLILGLRLYVRARSGELSAKEVEQGALELGSGDLAAGVMGDSLAAMALARVGQANVALPIALRTRARLDNAVPSSFLEVARLAEALVAIEVAPLEAARAAVKRLERALRSARSLQTATSMAKARLCIREGDIPGACALLASVVEHTRVHGERWHTMDAHLLLSELLAGRDVLAAQAHAARYTQLATELGVRAPKAPSPPAELPPAVLPPESPSDVKLWPLLNNMGETLSSVLPPEVDLQIQGAAGVRAVGDGDLIELLVVNVVLLVRDTVSGGCSIRVVVDEVEISAEDTAAHDLRAGRWAHIEICSMGPIGGISRGALAECRTLCQRCKGHLLVESSESSLSIQIFLPAPHGPPPRAGSLAAVVHGDPEVRRSLVDAIRQYGWSVVEVPPGEDLPNDATLILIEAALAHLAPPGPARVVRVTRRGERFEAPGLRIPFLVAELEALLTTPAAPSTTSGERPPG